MPFDKQRQPHQLTFRDRLQVFGVLILILTLRLILGLVGVPEHIALTVFIALVCLNGVQLYCVLRRRKRLDDEQHQPK